MELSVGYREVAPPPALRGSVACLWFRLAAEREVVRVVPDACADVIWTRGRGVMVAGPDTGVQETEIAAGNLLVGMRFRPGAGGGGLGVPLDELRDLRVEGRDVDRALAAERPRDVLVQRVAAGLEKGERVDVGLSARQLRRRFHAAVGYGPKTLERVLRFRRAVDAIDAGRTDLPAIALDAGYADQAHLTRECTRLAGVPPARLIRDRGARPRDAGTAAHPTR